MLGAPAQLNKFRKKSRIRILKQKRQSSPQVSNMIRNKASVSATMKNNHHDLQ